MKAPALAQYVDEIILGVALVLLTSGLWSRFGAVSLGAPAAVLLWIALPTRHPFMYREPPAAEHAGEKSRQVVRSETRPGV